MASAFPGKMRPASLGLEDSDLGVLRIRQWREVVAELHGVVEKAFHLIHRAVGFDMGAFFLLDPDAQVFRAIKVMSQGELLDGEEEMPLPPHSPLRRLLEGRKDFLVFGPPENAVFIPLIAFAKVLGVLRLDRWRQRRSFTSREKDFLRQVARSLGLAVWRIHLMVQERAWDNQLRTFNEVSMLIHQSLRLKKLLEDVAKRIVKNLGFDRVKVYLVDPKKKTLRGELGYTIFEGAMDISEEIHPIRPGVNPLVDALLGDGRPSGGEVYRETIRYIPLRARTDVTGILMVDNVLSQQEISEDEIRILEILAGQLGLAIKNAELYEGVEELSITDELTRLYLPRHFRERLEQECQRAARANGRFALCMLDVDLFKRINDTYGHPVGDRVLQGLARQLRAVSRKIDVLCRYGGDEFMILLPDTSAEQALQFAERLRESIERLPFPLPHEQALHVSVSVGVAVYPENGALAEDLIRTADAALLWGKSRGRNAVHLYSPEAERARLPRPAADVPETGPQKS